MVFWRRLGHVISSFPLVPKWRKGSAGNTTYTNIHGLTAYIQELHNTFRFYGSLNESPNQRTSTLQLSAKNNHKIALLICMQTMRIFPSFYECYARSPFFRRVNTPLSVCKEKAFEELLRGSIEMEILANKLGYFKFHNRAGSFCALYYYWYSFVIRN